MGFLDAFAHAVENADSTPNLPKLRELKSGIAKPRLAGSDGKFLGIKGNSRMGMEGIPPRVQIGGNSPKSPVSASPSVSAPPPVQAEASMLADSSKPILQLNKLPMTLDPALFKDARSSSNPTGDLRALYAFSQLVDVIPKFTHNYVASARSAMELYQQISEAASAEPGSFFASSVISQAQKLLDNYKFANMDGTVGSWHPTYAVPEDWYDMSKKNRFTDMDISPDKMGGNSGAFATIGAEKDLQWHVHDGQGEITTTATKNSAVNIKMKYLYVELRRPWFNATLFDTAGWKLGSQRSGFCSSGKITENKGVLPLLPVGMLLGKNIKVVGNWDKSDAKVLHDAKQKKANVYLGPFPANSEASMEKSKAESIQVIGWVSTLIPFSPA